jgi:hypothetical protein
MIQKVKFYHLFSWWTLGLLLLYKTGVVKFSILPSILVSFIGLFVFLYIKKQRSKLYNPNIVLLLILMHSFPLLIVPRQIPTSTDIFYNQLFFILYLTSLYLQDTDIWQVYNKHLNQTDSEVLVVKYYNDLFTTDM